MERVAYARRLVGHALDNLGYDSYEARVDRDHWAISHGSAKGVIGISVDQENPEMSTIYAAMRIMTVPLQRALPFYRKLLELNEVLLGRGALSVDVENTIWLNCGRHIEDLDESEVVHMVLLTTRAADTFMSTLLDEFGWEYAVA